MSISSTIISGAIGVIVGGIAGGYLMAWHCTRESTKTIEALKKTNRELLSENHKLSEKAIEKRQKAVEEKEKKVDKKLEKTTRAETYRKVLTDIGIPKDTEEENIDDKDDDDDEDEEKDESPIRLIDADTFRNDPGLHESETLYYYVEDGVLVDSLNNVVRNREKVIGDEGIDALEDATEEDGYIYIQNDLEDKMYQIYIDDSASYYRDVLGQG